MIAPLAHGLWLAARRLVRDWRISAIVVLTLALGVGANVAIFSLLNSLLLTPLTPHRQDALAVVGWQEPEGVSTAFSFPEFEDVRAASRGVAHIIASRLGQGVLRVEHQDARAVVSGVSDDYFAVLGLTPAAGQLFQPSRGSLERNPAVVLSYGYWSRTFAADRTIVGKAGFINRVPVTIIGVGPRDFHGDRIFANVDVFVPLGMLDVFGDEASVFSNRDVTPLRLLGLVEPGRTLGAFNDNLATTGSTLALQRRAQGQDNRAILRAYDERLARPNPRAARAEIVGAAFFGALAGLVLLLACVNATTLLLGRLVERRPELAVQMALGATPRRVALQLLAETLLLSVIAGAAGVMSGQAASIAIGRVLPASLAAFASRIDFQFDWRVVAFTTGVVLLTTIAAGILPAFKGSATSAGELLQPSSGPLPGRQRLRALLVAAQIAAAVVIVVVAGLFTRSLGKTRSGDFGFDPGGVLHMTVNTNELRQTETQSRQLYRAWLDDVRRLPGVEAASLTASLPMSSSGANSAIFPEQCLAADRVRGLDGSYTAVTPGYFQTMRIRLAAGRDFSDADGRDASPVAIVNRTLASTCWSGNDAIGRHFRLGAANGPSIEIVGIVDDAKEISAIQGHVPFFYVPLDQQHRATRTLLVRSALPAAAILPAIDKHARELAPDLRPFNAGMLADTIADAPDGLYLFRVAGTFAWTLGGLGLILALIGAYAITSQWVRQRTWELALRMALGADGRDVRTLILGWSARLLAAGVGAGIVGALILTRLLAFLFFDVSPWDPLTYALAIAGVVATSLCACYLPARTVTAFEPATILKNR
jgi:putative ABC transport system permease protein